MREHDGTQVLVQVLAVCEQGVQVNAAEQGTQGSLRDLAGGNRVVLNLKHRVLGVGHAEENHGVHAGGNVVLGDDFLRGNGQGDNTHINALQGVNKGEDDVQAGLQRPNAGGRSGKRCTLVFGDDAEHTNQNKKTMTATGMRIVAKVTGSMVFLHKYWGRTVCVPTCPRLVRCR